ncbi:MAG: glutamate synthase [Treponemataceae bacterium]
MTNHTIDASGLHFKDLNSHIKNHSLAGEKIVITNCLGHRYIGSGLSDCQIEINGTPGNALAAYMNGAEILVNGNVQDAVGDTMNDGKIVVHGGSGDALGYAMRGGKIFIKNNSGYRTGIHMKEYNKKIPVIIIGGTAGSFLGEYQAGGIIAVLNLHNEKNDTACPYGTGTGLHGGKIFFRTNKEPEYLPKQVLCSRASDDDLRDLSPHLREYSECFSLNFDTLIKDSFYVLKPNAKNPYKQMYVSN